MRFILFTGKGGVGKTTIAAATAVRCAQLGYPTLIISTDAAHSLQDSFEVEIRDEETAICQNLYGLEIDINEEIKRNWGPIQGFIEQFLKYRGFDNIIADELAVFPGMEEVFSLIKLKDYYVKGTFEVVVIDCAPTGDTLRLLAAPDIAKWYMEKIFNIERIVLKAVRPVAKRFVDMPLPTDDVFDTMEGLYNNLIGMKEVLTDQDISTIRLVINPEKMVIKESQKAYTYLNLFGYSVDAVVANRVLPPEIQDPFYEKWKHIQKLYLEEAAESFQPLPIITSQLWDQEIVGLRLLSLLAEHIYNNDDPTKIFFQERVMEIEEANGEYQLTVKLPFATKEELSMWIKGDELILRFKNYKRNIFLPRVLSSLKLKGAKLDGKALKIRFGGNDHEGMHK